MARGCALVDSAELKWLGEVKTKTFDQLGTNSSDRFRRADMVLGAALEQALAKSQETVEFAVDTNRAEMRAKDKMLTGRQNMRMILNVFRTDQSFGTQFVFQDLAFINWKG
eukprot:11171412-Lingulodinium_polyedra.AAC.1